MYENVPDLILLADEAEARRRLEELSAFLSEEEIAKIKEIFPDFFEETA
ncbi:MAG: hypothetical protein RXR31_05025 [Thermoproteota archaeon]